MKATCYVFAGILVSLLVFGSRTHAQQRVLHSNPIAGEKVFKEKSCQKCHAIRGQGGSVAQDLGWQEYYGNAWDLTADLWNHFPIMREVMAEMNVERPVFTEDEMSDLMTYLYYLRYLVKTGNVLEGKKLLSSKGCLTCHSIRGDGNEVGPRLDRISSYVSPLFMAQALWNHGPEMKERMAARHVGWPKFEDDEIVDLTNYVRILRKDSHAHETYLRPGNPEEGANLIESKGCLQCHAVQGKGADIAPAFEEMDLDKNVTEMAGLMWNHGESMIELVREKKLDWPRFDSEEIGDLISYLYAIDFMEQNGDADTGEQVFDSKGCTSCHSAQAGVASIGPALAAFEDINSPAQLAQIMWNHAPKMESRMQELGIAWPSFTRGEMEHLYEFLAEPKGLTEKR